MWKSVSLGLVIILISAAAGFTADFTPGKIYIKFDQESFSSARNSAVTGIDALDRLLISNGYISKKSAFQLKKKADPAGLARVILFEVDRDADMIGLAEKISQYERVEYAVPEYIRTTNSLKDRALGDENQIDYISDDPFYDIQWHLPAVNAAPAWDFEDGDPDVVIAIVDNGVDWDHPDLLSKIWKNSGEISGNGIDDDQNGYIDDVRGWDFVNNDNNPSVDGDPVTVNNENTHGTHVAGIAAGATNNGYGIAGVAPGCKIMPIKTGTALWITNGASGIVYAYENGAQVINCSWGGTPYSLLEADAAANASANGSLVIAAAGNNLSHAMHYPSALDGVMAVASIGPDNVKSGFSNYYEWVDVSAPGESIYSTVVLDGSGTPTFGFMGGTSMSTPVVAGVAGLIYSQHPDWNGQQVTIKIKNTCDDIYYANPSYFGQLGAGKVNAYRAVGEALPGIRFQSVEFDDSEGGDGDNIPEPGDTLSVIINLNNVFQAAYGVTAELSTTHNQVTILSSTSDFGNIPSGTSADNQNNPYRIRLGSFEDGEEVLCNLFVQTSNEYTFNLTFSFIVTPPYANHNAGNVTATVTNFGAVGYQDQPYMGGSQQIGEGFRYPASGGNALYHGSMVMASQINRVCSSIYRDDDYPFNFEWIDDGPISMQTPGMVSDQLSQAVYHDNNVFFLSPSISVAQNCYAWSNEPYDDFIILEFNFTNTSSNSLQECYFGMFLDWDVDDFYDNAVGFDAGSGTGYMYAPGSLFYGAAPLTHGVHTHRAIDNNIYTSAGALTDSTLYKFMTGQLGFQTDDSGENSHLVTVGPLVILPDSTVTVAFAILGGDTEEDLIANTITAKDKYESLFPGLAAGSRSPSDDFSILSVQPNPFNSELNLRFVINTNNNIEVDVFDILGRRVAEIINAGNQQGEKTLNWSPSGISSGVYFIRAKTDNLQKIQKVILVK